MYLPLLENLKNVGFKRLQYTVELETALIRETPAEYDTVKKVKESVKIPVLVNGDITDGKIASLAIRESGADGVMIGREACGNHWVFSMIRAHLDGVKYSPPDLVAILDVLEGYVESIYTLYGSSRGLLIARKHVKWFLQKSGLNHYGEPREFNKLRDVLAQKNFLTEIRKKNSLVKMSKQLEPLLHEIVRKSIEKYLGDLQRKTL